MFASMGGSGFGGGRGCSRVSSITTFPPAPADFDSTHAARLLAAMHAPSEAARTARVDALQAMPAGCAMAGARALRFVRVARFDRAVIMAVPLHVEAPRLLTRTRGSNNATTLAPLPNLRKP